MQKEMFSEFSEILLGTNGQRWPELDGTLVGPWRVIHRDYFGEVRKISAESVKHYCCGKAQYPRLVRKHYLGDQGLEMLQKNIGDLVCSSTSVIKIRSIQDQVYSWLQTVDLPEQERVRIEMCYVAQNADPKEIAAFLAAVMYCVIALS